MNYYAWRVEGKPVEVRLNLSTVRSMAPWLIERAADEPESFGILLGQVKRRWRRRVVWVEDFEPFDPTRLRGAPKAPWGTELEVVGLYRRRAGDLKLDHLDASFIQTAFTNPAMVYLLISAAVGGPDRASFFVQEHGEVHGYASVGDFPLAADLLPRSDASVGSKLHRWVPVAGVVASLIALAGWLFWLRRPTPPPAPVSAPAASAPVQQPAPSVSKPASSSTQVEHRSTVKPQRAAKHSKRRGSRKRH
jgi:hypothetical protein